MTCGGRRWRSRRRRLTGRDVGTARRPEVGPQHDGRRVGGDEALQLALRQRGFAARRRDGGCRRAAVITTSPAAAAAALCAAVVVVIVVVVVARYLAPDGSGRRAAVGCCASQVARTGATRRATRRCARAARWRRACGRAGSGRAPPCGPRSRAAARPWRCVAGEPVERRHTAAVHRATAGHGSRTRAATHATLRLRASNRARDHGVDALDNDVPAHVPRSGGLAVRVVRVLNGRRPRVSVVVAAEPRVGKAVDAMRHGGDEAGGRGQRVGARACRGLVCLAETGGPRGAARLGATGVVDGRHDVLLVVLARRAAPPVQDVQAAAADAEQHDEDEDAEDAADDDGHGRGGRGSRGDVRACWRDRVGRRNGRRGRRDRGRRRAHSNRGRGKRVDIVEETGKLQRQGSSAVVRLRAVGRRSSEQVEDAKRLVVNCVVPGRHVCHVDWVRIGRERIHLESHRRVIVADGRARGRPDRRRCPLLQRAAVGGARAADGGVLPPGGQRGRDDAARRGSQQDQLRERGAGDAEVAVQPAQQEVRGRRAAGGERRREQRRRRDLRQLHRKVDGRGRRRHDGLRSRR